jgi:hypothetical protein
MTSSHDRTASSIPSNKRQSKCLYHACKQLDLQSNSYISINEKDFQLYLSGENCFYCLNQVYQTDFLIRNQAGSLAVYRVICFTLPIAQVKIHLILHIQAIQTMTVFTQLKKCNHYRSCSLGVFIKTISVC